MDFGLPLRRLARAVPLLGAVLCLLAAVPAYADPADILGRDTLSGVADFRLVASDGEQSWTDGGFGKARFGGTRDGDWKARPVAAEGELIWQPRFSWAVSGTVVAAYQQGQEHPIDVVEAFVTVKPLPSGGTHFSARIGQYWPQISLEHQGADWRVADMITPSAINSWIGEEVKVIGAEATIAQDLGASQLSGTVGLFSHNDTAGTLLAFRGWALHDLKATGFGHQRLPELNDFMEYVQAPRTRPQLEIDDRVGFYGRVQLRMAAPVTLNAFYYSNRGKPEAVTRKYQWGWDTRFWNVGARVDLDPHTRILAQALAGKTEMGLELNQHYWVDTRFRSAYVRLSHDIGAVTLSARADVFATRERGSQMERREREHGAAGTLAASWKLSRHINFIGEFLHIDSKRGARERIGIEPRQRQNIIQTALRLLF